MSSDVQRLSERSTPKQVEKGDILPSNVGDEDIVWSAWKHAAAIIMAVTGIANQLRTQTKDLPFRSGFKEIVMTDPLPLFTFLQQLLDEPETSAKYDTIIIDSANFMMDNFEAHHITTAPDTRAAWGNYAKFFQALMQNYVPRLEQDVIMLCHTLTTYDSEGRKHTQVPIKGSLKNQGIEAFFSITVATKKVSLVDLEPYGDTPLRKVTPKEEARGFKYVYQTDLTKETAHERIRAPEDMWEHEETFIDNDITHVLKRLHEFYGE